RSQALVAHLLLERVDQLTERAGRAFEHVDVEHLVEWFDLGAYELVHPIELLLELGFGTEVPHGPPRRPRCLLASRLRTPVRAMPGRPVVRGREARRGTGATALVGGWGWPRLGANPRSCWRRSGCPVSCAPAK